MQRGGKKKNFFFVWRKKFVRVLRGGAVWSLKNLGKAGKIRMVDNSAERLGADAAIPDIGMAVFAGAAWIFAVVDMKDSHFVFSDKPV